MRRRTPAVALGTLLALLLMLAGVAGIPPAAYAVADPRPVIVDLEAVEPALPARDGTITLRGTATNRSEEPITAAQVVFWRRTPAITDGTELTTLTNQEPSEVHGAQVWGTETSYRRLTGDQKPVWEPGEALSFEVAAPVADLSFAPASGVFLIGVEVVGELGQRPLITLGLSRSMVPLGADGVAATTGTNRVVSAVLLSSRPSMISPGVFRDDHLAGELAPRGRLTQLLAAASRDDVSWLIDPALYQEITTMAAGYRVEGQSEPDPAGQQHAVRWLSDFGQLNRDNGYRAPFALPDVSMLARHDLTGIMDRAVAAGEQMDRIADLPLLVYVEGGLIDPDALPLAEAGAPVAILAANPDARRALLSPIDAVPLIDYSADTTEGGPGPEPSAGEVQVRQRMLSQSFLAAVQEPGATTVRVINTGGAAVADPIANAPWVRRATVGALLSEPPADWSTLMPYGEQAQGEELGPEQVENLREIIRSYDRFADMLVDPEPTEDEIAAALARSASSWWRGDPAGFDAFIGPMTEAVRPLWSGQAVSLTAQRSVLMSGQSGSFPITVTNRLTRDVRVTLTFESDQPQRLSIPPMPNVVVGSGQSVTVNVQPQAVGNGPVGVSGLATTPDGTPVSKRLWLTVEATDLGRVGWIIVVASGIVLLAATMLRIRQVRRERADTTPPDRPMTSEASEPAEKPGPSETPGPSDVPLPDPTVHPTPPVVTIDRSSRGDER